MPEAPLKMATAEQVWQMLAKTTTPLQPVCLSCRDAFGHFLAEDVASTQDYPPFDRAVMDGFAIRAADLEAGSARLRCRGLVAAGNPHALRVESGMCVQINTGGPLPSGADAIVIVEKAERESEDWVRLTDRPAPGQHIEKRGGIVTRGGVIARDRTRVGAGTLAALISGGVKMVRCHPAPRVSLLCTGDELVDAGQELRDAQIPDSNSAVLEQLIRESGGSLRVTSRAADEREHLVETLRSMLDCDLLVVTGGMSKGSHDLVPGVLEDLGITWFVTSLDLKPGKPTRIGRMPGGAWVLGLPGNPVSCAVCFLLFGRPILLALQGQSVSAASFLRGILDQAVPANGARPMYHPANWYVDQDGQIRVAPIHWRGSGDPFGMAGANALLKRERDAPPAAAGEHGWFVPLSVPNSNMKV